MEKPSFHSFWMGGYEGAHQRLCGGERVDMIAATQHDRCVIQDYKRLAEVNMRTVRESARWHLIDRDGGYDFSSMAPMVQAARQAGIQIIWSLMHYGWPVSLDPFSPAFVERFARYSRAVAGYLADQSDDIPFYNPINEISFLSWAVGQVGFMHPCQQGRGQDIKQQFIRAAVAAMDAIWEVDPRARFIHFEPAIQVIAPPGRPDLARYAAWDNGSQYQAWDMLGGWDMPELGGDPRYLDIVAVNYYHDNQWELERPRLSWEERLESGDKRWLRFHQMLENVYHRYQRPLLVGETSHFGIGRGPWIRMIAEETLKAHELGVPVSGICLYPLLDRHEWHDPEHWHNSGLWDIQKEADGTLTRIMNETYCEFLKWSQSFLARAGLGDDPQAAPEEGEEIPGINPEKSG
jgi:hypothetical protein